jgi:uncharacterized protein (DUF1501 family)
LNSKPVEKRGLRRRDFLRAGAMGPFGLGLARAAGNRDVSCILLMLTGGPSQLDTFDMKPDAPADIRGPFRPIRTNVAGIEISEIFPRTARHADKFSLVRSVYRSGDATHEAGGQAIETNRLAALQPAPDELPAHVVLPAGNGAADALLDLRREPESLRRKYGSNPFGQNCLRARRLVEAGVRLVTVNMFDTVFDRVTWDIHGWKPFSAIGDYRDVVGPMFDMAYSTLFEDLCRRDRLSRTMVIAAGEFGRTPKLNSAGGRDHWPQCWTVLMGGGPLRGGTVVGASDAIAAAPKDRPVTPADIAATVYRGFGLDPRALVEPGAAPIGELFA